MKIVGIQKTSFIDYPGEISTVLFTSGCNLRCPYCHNAELVLEKTSEIKCEWIDWLNNRKKNIKAIVISGGEPTLQEDLISFIEELKKEDYKVKLDTNGSSPEMLEYLFENKLIDYIAMDIKGPLSSYKKFGGNEEFAIKVKKSIELIKKKAIDYEFRTTMAEGILNEAEIEDMISLLDGSKRYYLQNFKDGDQIISGKGKFKSLDDKSIKLIGQKFKPHVKTFDIR